VKRLHRQSIAVAVAAAVAEVQSSTR